tara:strand:- start:48 stop:323 length:276 start_codon:yes stop_codon:yes gene_type:complete
MSESTEKRVVRKERIGIVSSDAQDKTIVVRVDRKVPHPIYKKVINRSKKFHAHDPENSARIGDKVRIIETRPLSKLKRWKLVEVLARAEVD